MMPSAQSMFDPVGPQAARIETLWWIFFFVSLVIVLGVVFAVGVSVSKSLRADGGTAPFIERSRIRVVSGLVGLSLVVVFGLLILSVATGSIISDANAAGAMRIEVTASQWWWEIRYPDDAVPSNTVVTANEIHIPVGRKVEFLGSSTDVIHSLWIPNLHGKRDLIPSRQTRIWIQADRAGTWRGQCAEYCGLQHAHMALVLVAEPETQFAEWQRHEAGPARAPQSDAERRGLDVFLKSACISCHSIRGAEAFAQVGPDLTHFGARQTIASATLPATTSNLTNWIRDPQAIKPGSRMPRVPLSRQDLEDLVTYLESLR
jgi:cytochrome c oxidase subunit 2